MDTTYSDITIRTKITTPMREWLEKKTANIEETAFLAKKSSKSNLNIF